MKKYLLFSIVTTVLLLFSNTSFSQTPNGTLNLGILESFEAYTGAGGVANSGGTVTGDVGTHLGIISGFTSPPYTGNTYNANAVTDQARYDLLRLYIHLNALFVDFPNAFDPVFFPAHAPAFGSGETISPGVYSIGGAGSIGGALTLNGGGDPDAVFVIKMNGALTVGAGATVSLTNGTKSSNVFWLINGAISVAAGAEVKGTLFAKAGAVGLGANVILEGRMLSLAGAITMGIGSSATPPLPSTIPIFCEADRTPAPAVDILGVLSGFALFASAGNVGNTDISGINGTIGTNAGAITGYTGGINIGTQEIANALTVQAAADLDAAYIALMAMTPSVTHAATFLNETLAPGIYHIPAAGALGGVIILDAANDPNAIFVFRFAGAFNIAAASKIILANGARRCNVFWLGGAGVATGAVNIGASSEVQGTFLAHGGACNSGAGVFMAGRQLSTLGAVNTDNCVIYNNPECVTSTSLGDAPAVALVKTASVGGTGILGDEITYTFAVTNTGNITLTNVVVTDPMVGLVISGSPIASLAVGASSSVITGTYTITQTDIDAGSVTNSATATSDEGATDISGTANDNDTPTVTTTLIPAVTDFTPTIDINALTFGTEGVSRDFVVNVAEILNSPSVGSVVIMIPKLSAFTITFNPVSGTSDVFGSPLNNNSDWTVTESAFFITCTLNVPVIIEGFSISRIGFNITRKTGVAVNTSQNLTATIVIGSGDDSNNFNNGNQYDFDSTVNPLE